MPFKSKAQRRKFAQLLTEGKITAEAFEEWNRSTGKKVLPERIHPKKPGSTTPSGKRKSRAKQSPGSQKKKTDKRRRS